MSAMASWRAARPVPPRACGTNGGVRPGDRVAWLGLNHPDQITLLVPVLQQQNTWQRYEWLSRRVADLEGKIDVEQAVRILATGPVHADNTLHSFVFDPKNQDAWIAIAGNNPPVTATDTPFTRVNLSEWFK